MKNYCVLENERKKVKEEKWSKEKKKWFVVGKWRKRKRKKKSVLRREEPGERGSIPGRVIPKTQKMVLSAALLNTQHYKVRIKGKVE